MGEECVSGLSLQEKIETLTRLTVISMQRAESELL